MKKPFFAFTISICLLITHAFAIGISPPGIDAGSLDLATPANFSFEIKNQNTYPYSLNITLELLQSSAYLEPYVAFTPKSIMMTPSDKKIAFTVTVGGDVPPGNHLLVFRPGIDILDVPEMNDTGSVNIAGMLVSTTASYIDFAIPSVPVPEPSPPSSSGSSGGPSAVFIPGSDQGSDTSLTIVTEYAGLTIEVPALVKAVEPGVAIKIRLKNTGDINLSLIMDLIGSPPLSIEYDPKVGIIPPGSEKYVEAKLANFSRREHSIRVIVSDSGINKVWSAGFNVVVPEAPRGIAIKDCISYSPKNYTVVADRESRINMAIRNDCNTSISNLKVMIESLNYMEMIGDMLEGEDTELTIDVLLKESISHHTVLFEYDEGETIGQLRIDSKASYLSLILPPILFMMFIIMILFIVYPYIEKRKNKIMPEVPKEYMEKIERLTEEINNTDRLISDIKKKKSDLESRIKENLALLEKGERTEKQLSLYLKKIYLSIEEKQKELDSLKKEEQSSKDSLGRKKASREVYDQLESALEKEKQKLEELKSRKELVRQKNHSFKKSLADYQSKMDMFDEYNSIQKLEDTKKNLDQVNLALERLYNDNVISKEIYDSKMLVKMEIENIEKKIKRKIKERDVVLKETNMFFDSVIAEKINRISHIKTKKK